MKGDGLPFGLLFLPAGVVAWRSLACTYPDFWMTLPSSGNQLFLLLVDTTLPTEENDALGFTWGAQVKDGSSLLLHYGLSFEGKKPRIR